MVSHWEVTLKLTTNQRMTTIKLNDAESIWFAKVAVWQSHHF